MLESFQSGKFEYKRLTEDEQKQRGILGRLKGIIADTTNSTRNGRKYSLQLWKNVFDNDVMKEKIANRCVFSELGHPENREEVDMSKVCACLAEQPKICDDGKIYGVFDILSTPAGHILKSLCDYGTTVGVSSRGTGDLYTDDEGNEAVDPDTYNCECFDIVLVPAVKEARMQYVTESLDKKRYNKTLRQTLQESIEKASDEDRVIMNEALDNLGIKLSEEVGKSKDSELKEWKTSEEASDHKTVDDPTDYRIVDAATRKKECKVTRANLEHLPFTTSILYKFRFNKKTGELRGKDYIGIILSVIPDSNGDMLVKTSDYEDSYEYTVFPGEALDKIVEESLSTDLEDSSNWFKNKYGKEAYDAYIKFADENPEVYNNLYGEANINKFLAQHKKDERLISTLRDSQEAEETVEEIKEECNNESCADKDAEEVVNDKSGELVAELQEALLKVKELEDDNLSLQERLSVCNAKENQLQEQLDKYKKATINLSESAKQVKTLSEYKEKLTEDLNKQKESASKNKTRITSLIDTKKDLLSQLTEAKAKVDELNNQVSVINEELDKNSKQLEKSNQLVEKYRKNYAVLKESYLEVKAANYGINKSELKTNLKESYTLKDVDSLCEELAEKKSKLNKLPFVINENTNISFKKSSNEYIMNESFANNSDDYVSDSLLHLANLK